MAWYYDLGSAFTKNESTYGSSKFQVSAMES